MMLMNEIEYKELVEEITPKENLVKDIFLSFLMGGLLGLIAEFLYHLWGDNDTAKTMIITTYIIGAGLATGLGWFDKVVYVFKSGLLIPITGFAHAMTAAAIEHKKEGLVTGIGANIFKLTGTVLLYGIVGASLVATFLLMMGWL